MSLKRVLTWIKPTGEQIHLGNYFGAVKPMVEFVHEGKYEVFMFIANLHALTEFHDPDGIKQNTYNLVKSYLACGLDSAKVHIYNQSDVVGHLQLFRTLACITNVGFMKRMHAYKAAVDAGKGDEISIGTFNYPVLMAADILLYDADFVPVGKDQKQHVEYARDIAEKFNNKFGETFNLPQPMINAEVATVPGTDGRKMSKSYNNYIGLFESADEIAKKIMRIPTAAIPVEEPKNPDECNVYNIYKLFLNDEQDKMLRKRYEAGGLSFKTVKEELAGIVVSYLAPIKERYEKISDAEVKKILDHGAKNVQPLAEKKIQQVYEKTGFIL